MKNLAEKLTEMKNEFYQTKNEKIMMQQNILKELEELKNQNLTKNRGNALLVAEKIKQKQMEGEAIHAEISKLELNCKKKETLFNKYLILLRNKCTKTPEESYLKNNPCLILENNFEGELKEEMIASLGREKSYLSDEDLLKYGGTIDIYFRDLFERERTCQLILLQRTKIENNLREHQDTINSIVDQIQDTTNEIELKKMRFKEVSQNLRTLQQRIESRNRTLKFNLENLSENNFMEYLNANEEVLKSMKRIYGNKILSKVFKVQKEKFFENVMLDHSFKKVKINEFVKLINQYEKTIADFENRKEDLLESHDHSSNDLKDQISLIVCKNKEFASLGQAKKELMENVENMLYNEMEEITNEKIKLRQKLNCDFYFVKVKDLAKKLENMKDDKQKVLDEFFKFRDVIIQREHKLYKDELDMKKDLGNLDKDEEVNNDLIGSIDNKFGLEKKDSNNTIKEGNISPVDELSDNYEMNMDNMDMDDQRDYKTTINAEGNESLNEIDSQLESQNSGKRSQIIETSNFLIIFFYLKFLIVNLYEHKKLLQQNSELKLGIDKVRPFVNGLNVYKKLSKGKKNFDIALAKDISPQSCGYAIRTFHLNGNILEIKKDKKIETKINVGDLNQILITPQVTKIIQKYKKNISTKPNSLSLITSQKSEENNEFVNFQLILEKDSIDLLAHNYMTFISFSEGIEELCKYKKNKILN